MVKRLRGWILGSGTYVIDGMTTHMVAERLSPGVVLDASPLEDIANTQRIALVVMRGSVVFRR